MKRSHVHEIKKTKHTHTRCYLKKNIQRTKKQLPQIKNVCGIFKNPYKLENKIDEISEK